MPTIYETANPSTKVRALQKYGYDPTQFDIDSEGFVIPRQEPLNVTQPLPLTPPAPTEIANTESLGRGAAEGLIPTILGLGGAAAGLAAAPATGGLSALLLPILGGAAGGIGGSLLQRKVVPEEVQERFFSRPEDFEQNPVATTVGNFIPSVLGFNPIKGATQVPKLAGAIGKFLTSGSPKALTDAERALLMNYGIAAGLEGGINTGVQLASGQEFSAPELLASIGLSTLLNEPSKIGRKLGFRGSEDFPTFERGVRNDVIDVPSRVVADTTEEPVRPIVDRESTIRQRDFERAKEELKVQEELPKLQEEITGRQLAKEEVRPEVIDEETTTRTPATEEPPLTEAEVRQEAEDILASRERRRAGKRFRQEETKLTAEDLADVKNLPDNIRQQLEGLTIEQAKRRGFQVDLVEDLTDIRTGKTINGDYDPDTGRIRLSSDRGADTGFHETFHGYMRDLATSTAKDDNDLVARGLDIFAKTDEEKAAVAEFKRLMSSGQKDEALALLNDTSNANLVGVQEELAQAMGVEGFNRALTKLTGSNKLKFKSWFRGLSNRVKNRFGLTNNKEVLEFFAARQEQDAPFGTRSELLPSAAIKTPEVAGDVGSLTTEESTSSVEGLSDTSKGGSNATEDSVPGSEAILKGKTTTESPVERLRKDIKTKYPEHEFTKKFLQDVKTTEEADTKLQQAQSAFVKEPSNVTSKEVYDRAKELTDFMTPDMVATHATEGRIGRVILNVFGSAIDKVRLGGSATHRYAANTLYKYFDIASELEGPYVNRIQAELTSVPKESRVKLDRYLAEMDNTGKSKVELTAEELAVTKKIRKYLEDVANDNTRRVIKKDPNYYPNILSAEVANAWAKNQNSIESKRFKRLWLEHAKTRSNKGKSAEGIKELEANITDFIRALAGEGGEFANFGPLSREAGIGLPIELQETDMIRRMTRYGRRVARDMAYFKILQSDPIMRYAMGLEDQEGHTIHPQDAPKLPDGTLAESIEGEATNKVKKFIFNDFNVVKAPTLNAFARLINSAILGPATQIRNTIQIPLNVMPQINRLGNVKVFLTALGRMKHAWDESLAYNARRVSYNDLETGAFLHPNKFVSRVVQMADFLRKWQGRDIGEGFERAYEFAMGELVALEEIPRAIRGDKKAEAWVRTYGRTVDNIDQYLKPGVNAMEIPQEVISKIAKTFVDRASGTYDARGLPAGVLEGTLAPFFALSRWSIERTNIIYKDVVLPALRDKNFGPLVAYTLGGLATGEVIRRVNEVLNNSKQYSPTFEEASVEENKAQQVRAVIGLLQLSAYGGIVSDLVKTSVEVYSGNKYPRGPISFPLLDFITETLGEGLTNYSEAIKNGENQFDTTLRLLEHITVNAVQGVRMVANQTWKAEDKERSGKFRDLRVFQELQGLGQTMNVVRSNPFMDYAEREFKRTDDLAEAAELAPKVIKRQIEKSTRASGEIDVENLRKELKGAKTTSFQTIPNPETQPLTAYRYLKFLEETQGEEAAKERLLDFMRQRAINKAKGSLIPQL